MPSYAYLKTDIINTTENDSTEFEDQIPKLIEKTELRLTKDLDDVGLDEYTAITFTAANTSIALNDRVRIIRNVNYGKEERKKVDALIVQQKNVIVVVEYKKPSEFKTKAEKNKAIKQEIEVAKKIGSNIIIATDTKESVWVNVKTGKRIKDEDGKELKYNFNPKDEKLPDLIEKIISSINEINDQIKPKKLVNPTDLAKQIWQDIWSVSGATPENCLYTFVELFIFKYLSDLGILVELLG